MYCYARCAVRSDSIYLYPIRHSTNARLGSVSKNNRYRAAAVLGFLIFGEMPTGNQVVGGMIVILGICMYTLYASKTENE